MSERMHERPMQEVLAAWLRSSGPRPDDLPATAADWQALARGACDRGLAGLIIEAARQADVELPTAPARTLAESATTTAAENLNALHVLGDVLHALNQADVPVMLLKGAALNLGVYPHPDLRPMADVDLLVRAPHAARAVEALEEAGCRRGVDLLRDDFFPQYHYELELLTNSPRPVRLDLHARPFRPLRLARVMPDEAFWDDAKEIDVAGATAHVPRPEVMFLHLAAHAAYHGCNRLLWLYDLERLSQQVGESMDWSVVTDRARTWRLSLPVARAIERASELFGLICPPSVLPVLAADHAGWRDRLTLAQTPRDADTPIRHVLVNLLTTPGVRFRMGYLRAVMLPGRRHLGELYKRRHPGWTLAAHLSRGIRAARRVLLPERT